MDQALYNEITQQVIKQCGWYYATLQVMCVRFPRVNPERLIQLCNLHGVHAPPKGCGYQGSLSPAAFDKLVQALEAEGGAIDSRMLQLYRIAIARETFDCLTADEKTFLLGRPYRGDFDDHTLLCDAKDQLEMRGEL